MNSSDIPARHSKAWAVNGSKNTIPTDSSSTTLNNGTATFDSGFPPLTMVAQNAGGIPPDGKDLNGALYSVTLKQQWQDMGGGYPFNSDFASAISGYPKGAMIQNSNLDGLWLSTTNNNNNSPENTNGVLTGWVPVENYGNTVITGLGASSLTLTAIQAAKETIILSGRLTANINIVFPAWQKSWTVVNNCTGGYVICKTPSGSGVIVYAGSTALIYGNGTSILTKTPSSFSTIGAKLGHLIHPSGIIEQWGTQTFSPGAQAINITLSIPWPNGYLSGTISDTGIGNIPHGVSGSSTTQITAFAPKYVIDPSTATIIPRGVSAATWRVIGY